MKKTIITVVLGFLLCVITSSCTNQEKVALSYPYNSATHSFTKVERENAKDIINLMYGDLETLLATAKESGFWGNGDEPKIRTYIASYNENIARYNNFYGDSLKYAKLSTGELVAYVSAP